MRGVIRRKKLARIHIESEYFVNSVRIFRAIETMQTGLRQFDGDMAIELVFQILDHGLHGFGIRPWRARLRHHACAKFSDHLLPFLGVLFDVRDIQQIEREPTGFQLQLWRVTQY